MAIRESVETVCDTCSDKISSGRFPTRILTVIFTTEQTEGRSVKPYLWNANLHICKGCEDRLTTGCVIVGEGAQGHNRYRIQENL